MDRIEKIEVTRTKFIHNIYCDKCGKFIERIEENDEGYYVETSEFELSLLVENWFRIRENLCKECREKFMTKLRDFLCELGFEEDKSSY